MNEGNQSEQGVQESQPQNPQKDTHGHSGRGWVGFDLDGTLARYDGWKGVGHIGEPIAPMITRLKALHEKGVQVKIVTARVADPEQREVALARIKKWLETNIGLDLEVTHEKDACLIVLFDDRVEQVMPNTGRLVSELYHSESEISEDLRNRFTYHPPKADQPARYEQIRRAGLQFAALVQTLGPGRNREQSMALTKIEEAVFWANASIARNE